MKKGSRHKPSSSSCISCPKVGFGSLLRLVLMKKKVGWIKATKTHMEPCDYTTLLSPPTWDVPKKPVVKSWQFNYQAQRVLSLDFCPSRVFKRFLKISQKVQTPMENEGQLSSRYMYNINIVLLVLHLPTRTYFQVLLYVSFRDSQL